MCTLLIDNHDSFTYNLLHLLQQSPHCPKPIRVVTHDVMPDEVDEVEAVVISPGPGLPEEAGALMAIIAQYHTRCPILGICLGHQALAQFFGAELCQLPHPIHGGVDDLLTTEDPLFEGTQDVKVARYHSWVVDAQTVPACLRVVATTKEGLVMALRHTSLPIAGFQFHPESFVTTQGVQLVDNFFQYCKNR